MTIKSLFQTLRKQNKSLSAEAPGQAASADASENIFITTATVISERKSAPVQPAEL